MRLNRDQISGAGHCGFIDDNEITGSEPPVDIVAEGRAVGQPLLVDSHRVMLRAVSLRRREPG